MTQLPKENQPIEAVEPAGMFARGLHALNAITGVVKKKAVDYVDGIGEKARQENLLLELSGAGNANALRKLMGEGVDPRAPSQSHLGTVKAWTPLHKALASNDEASSFTLVEGIRSIFSPAEASAAINAPEGQFGDSPLMMAVKLDQRHTAHALLAAGGDPGQGNREGVTPFMEMCRRGHVEMVKSTFEMLDQGKTASMLHKVDADGFNSLFHSIAGGAPEAVKQELLSLHAEKKFDCAGKYGPDGYTAVHVASLVGEPAMIRELVDIHKGDVNSLSAKEGLTPTMVAAWSNQPDSVKMLSSYPDLYINAKRNADDTTALHIAGVRGHQETIIALVHCGADLNAKDAQNQTPSDLAKYLGQNETAQLLRRLDPESEANSSLTQILLQRAHQALNSMKPTARVTPNL